jgi:hypothetical protein
MLEDKDPKNSIDNEAKDPLVGKEGDNIVVPDANKSCIARTKKFLKAISAGGVENGIYFKKNK